MQLQHLLEGVPLHKTLGSTDREIADFHFDSREVKTESLFVAVKGTQVDGHQFIEKAIKQGACAIVCEALPEELQETVTYVELSDSQHALAVIAANFYGNPARHIKVVGITGTNGKTSVATLLHRLFQSLGHMSGLVSTINYLVGNEVYPSSHTTPDPKRLHQMFARMWEDGCEYCFMEVSSHALAQQRTQGIPFVAGVFTNITHDHLDYHGTFSEYIRAKKLLFDQLPAESVALINVDDRNARVMVQNCTARVRTFAVKRMADYKARILENTFEGLQLEISNQEVWFRLVGQFNVYNLLAVYGIAVELGLEPESVLRKLSSLGGVEGRFQAIRSSDGLITAIVDYAHTPDALQNVLQTIAEVNQGKGNVLTVVGCGGNRDQSKRPKMAAIAARNSDQVILTSDNPRFEKPEEILRQMQEGVSLEDKRKVLVIENRREAIKTVARLAHPQDVILIAGKGHETYQEIEGVRYPFDDRQVISEAFSELGPYNN